MFLPRAQNRASLLAVEQSAAVLVQEFVTVAPTS